MRKPTLQGTASALAVGIIIVVIALATQYRDDRQQKNSFVLAPSGTLTTQENRPTMFAEQDTDGDSLKDWEEVLRGTDAHNPDTDGDGTSDGEEVAQGRDPTVAGPDDAVTENAPGSLAPAEATPTDISDLTHTEQFSRAFITSYIDTQVAGSSFDSQADLLAGLAIPQLERLTPPTPSLFTTLNRADEQTFHDYGNAVGAVLHRNSPGTENELVILFDILGNNSVERVEELQQIATAYEANAHDLETVPVPLSALERHRELAYAFALTAQSIDALAHIQSDPLLSLAGLEAYFTHSERLIAALKNLGTLLSTQTTFTQQEDGYILISAL